MTTTTATTTAEATATPKPNLLDLLERAVIIVASVSMIGVVAAQAWQVVARYVFHDPPSWTEPVALIFVASAAMLGAAAGVRREMHFSFPTLVDLAPPLVRNVCRTVARLSMLAVGVGCAVYGTQLALDSGNLVMAGAPLPASLHFWPVAVGGVLISIFSIERLFKPSPAAAHDPDEELD